MPLDESADGRDVRTESAQEEIVSRRARVTRLWDGTGVVLGWAAVFFAASAALYCPGLRAGYFSDDLLFFFNSPPAHLYDYFAMRGAAAQAYRPLEAIILTLIQQHFWFDTLPIHLLALGAHAGLVCAVLMAARRLALRAAELFLACAFMLVAQVGAPGVLGNDTLSQVASTFFGGISALFLCLVWLDRQERRVAGGREAQVRGVSGKWLVLSVIAYTTSLFFKETALGFFVVVLLLIALIAHPETGWAGRIKTAFKLSIPYGVATIVYGMARLHAGGPVSQSGSYRIHIGLNIFRNISEFSLAAFGPASTVDGAVAVEMHRIPELVLVALGWILIVAVMLAGIYISGRPMLCLSLGVAAVASLFPVYLLTHVSELYLYNAMPFLALILGIAFGSLWYGNRLRRAAAVVCASLLIGGQIYADREKARLMALNGKRAGVIYTGIERYLRVLPPDSRILLVNPPNRIPEYSVFLLKGFDVVDIGNLRIGPIFGRPDVRVELVEESQARGLEQRKNQLLLTLNANGELRRYEGLSSSVGQAESGRR